ncbi:MAG: hypothetical protein MZV64_19855 [Ignavibacteriales bacterium]|nr:hypothetical protein [Ignavibacteriales bacterium]
MDVGSAPDHRRRHRTDLHRLLHAPPGHRRPRTARPLRRGLHPARRTERPDHLHGHPPVPHHPPRRHRRRQTPRQESFSMTADMRVAFFFALFAFTIIFIDLYWQPHPPRRTAGQGRAVEAQVTHVTKTGDSNVLSNHHPRYFTAT